jgi:hypothetical protein
MDLGAGELLPVWVSLEGQEGVVLVFSSCPSQPKPRFYPLEVKCKLWEVIYDIQNLLELPEISSNQVQRT